MFDQNISPTKEKIYRAAARMFSKLGYDNVTMEDLAKAVGIAHSSIYNHFRSKKDILLGLYQAYTEQCNSASPDVNAALESVEAIPPVELLLSMDFEFDQDTEEIMRCILAIATRNMQTDADSRQFIIDTAFSASDRLVTPIVTRLIELGKIEPIDIEAFASILDHYAFSSIALVATPMNKSAAEWRKGLEYLYTSLIKPAGKWLN
jgi:AcrR family transcriptional regulator